MQRFPIFMKERLRNPPNTCSFLDLWGHFNPVMVQGRKLRCSVSIDDCNLSKGDSQEREPRNRIAQSNDLRKAREEGHRLAQR